MVNKLEVYGASRIQEVIAFMKGEDALQPTVIDTRKEFYDRQQFFDCDFSDVRGQENVKRALEVAAAGGHNLIMVGPCLLYTSPSPRDLRLSRMPSSA